MTDDQRVSLLREITAVLEIPMPRREDEITIAEAAIEWHCSETTARRRLQRAVADGLLREREAAGPNGSCRVFSLVQDD